MPLPHGRGSDGISGVHSPVVFPTLLAARFELCCPTLLCRKTICQRLLHLKDLTGQAHTQPHEGGVSVSCNSESIKAP